MNERDLAKRFQADLKTWLEQGELPDDPDAPQAYRNTLDTACSLSQAAVEADPEFHTRLEQRLQGHARENLPRQARQTAMWMKFSSALGLAGGAVLLLVLALGLSLIFNRIRPWGIGSGDTPTPEGSPTAVVNQTKVSQNQLSTPIPSIPVPTPLPIELQVTQSDDGLWTTYRDPEWQQSGQPITISALAIGPDGEVWAGTVGESGPNGVGPNTKGAGTYRFEQGKWTRFTDQDGIPFTVAMDIASGSDGKMWFATPCCGVSSFDGKTWTTYTTANGLQTNNVWHLASAPDGALWLGTADKGAVRFDGKVWQDYTPDNSSLWGKWVMKAFVLPDGSLLFSSQQFDILPDGSLQPSNSGTLTSPINSGSFFALNRFDGQTWSRFGVPGGPTDGANSIASGPDGSLWFTADGVYRLKDGAWTHYTVQDGLAGNGVRPVVVSSDNVVWVGTDSGLSRFDGAHWTTYTTRDGLASDFVYSLAMAPDGTLWVGTAGGISHYAPTTSSLAQETQTACLTKTYVVQKGDSLTKIASDFNISVGALLDYNHADASNPGSLVLVVGDNLIIPLCAQVQALSLKSSHDLIRQRMFNPTWRTLWVQGQSATFTSTGVQNNTYLQAWLNRLEGSGRVLATDTIPGSLGFTLDMDPRFAWVGDGKTITSVDTQSGQPAALAQGIMHPLDRANPVLGVIFPAFLAIRSEDLQPVRMDQQAGRTALVADWASYRIWIDAQTGVLLRSQTRDQAGQITQDAQVTAIAYDVDIPAAELNADQLSQARFEPAPAGASSGTSILWTDQTLPQPGPIVFSASTDLGTELFSIDRQGSNITQLTHDNANNVSPSCSVDGIWIAFTSIRGSQSAIYLLAAQGGGEIRLIDNPSKFVDLSFSPDGKKIAFVSEQDGNPEIYVMEIDGADLTRLTNNQAVDDSPGWSPDGRQIAFASNRDGPYQIYVMASDGSGQTNLSNSQTNDLAPAWSPDGSKIAFTSSERGANSAKSEIYVMLQDGSAVAALTTAVQGDQGRQYYNPAWSPDGKWIAFFSDQVGSDGFVAHKGIFEMPSDGSGLIGLQVQITPGTMDVTGRPCWQPATDPSTTGGTLAPLPTATPGSPTHSVPITPFVTGANIGAYAWSPDARWLPYVDFTAQKLYFYDTRQGKPCEFPDPVGSPNPGRFIAWLPDGRVVVQAVGQAVTGIPCGSFSPATGAEILALDHQDPTFSTDARYQVIEQYLANNQGPNLTVTIKEVASGNTVAETSFVKMAQGGGTITGGWIDGSHFLIPFTADQGPLLLTPGKPVVHIASDIFKLPLKAGSGDYDLWTARVDTTQNLSGFHLMLVGPTGTSNPLQIYHSESGQVETLPYLADQGAFSNDGHWLLVTAAAAQGNKVMIRPIDPPGSVLQPFDGQPGTWSPDGSKYFLVDNDQIRLYATANNSLLGAWQVSGYEIFPSWSPDGKTLSVWGRKANDTSQESVFVIPVQ